MLGYLLRRILAAIPVMGVVALFVFLLLRLTPGDPAAILAGDNASLEQLERIRTSLGLNEPLYAQFFTWIGKLLHGDLGVSLISNVPVLRAHHPADLHAVLHLCRADRAHDPGGDAGCARRGLCAHRTRQGYQ
jgi:ABC-type dipeptide/oligopeptide/nickel transport system permease component